MVERPGRILSSHTSGFMKEPVDDRKMDQEYRVYSHKSPYVRRQAGWCMTMHHSQINLNDKENFYDKQI